MGFEATRLENPHIFDVVVIDFGGVDPGTPPDEEARRRIGDEVEVFATTFLARAKRTSVYFVFSLGEEKSMEAPEAARGSMNREVRRRIFAGNTVNLFLAMMVLNFVLFLFVGSYAILAIVGVQALLLFYSDRLVLGSGNVRPDKDRPEVAVVRVTSTPEVGEILAKTGEGLLSPIRGELGRAISERTIQTLTRSQRFTISWSEIESRAHWTTSRLPSGAPIPWCRRRPRSSTCRSPR